MMTAPRARDRASAGEIDRLKARYPECDITRMPDWSVRAKHPDWPHPARTRTAAEMADTLARYRPA